MSDLINGREMLNRYQADLCYGIACKDCSMSTEDGGCKVEEWIDKFPSADRPQEWIPCSERLPEEKEVVAVIIKRWDTGEIKKGITYRVDRNMWVGFGRHNKACVWWLPLPPWKGADDE